MRKSMIARVSALEGQETRLAALVEELAKNVRREPGNLRFLVYRHEEEPGRFSMLEAYRDEAAFEAHLNAPHTQAFDDALGEVAKGGASEVTDLAPFAAEETVTEDLRAVDHVGLTVPNVEDAARFLVDAFGAVRVYDVLPKTADPMEGDSTERQLGLPEGAKIVHMRLMRLGDGPCLELFQIEDAERQRPAPGLQDHGLTHLGLYADGIAAATERFETAGGTLLSPVHGLAGVEAGDANAGVYGRTPWGMLVEFLTYPDGIDYPDASAPARWTPLPEST